MVKKKIIKLSNTISTPYVVIVSGKKVFFFPNLRKAKKFALTKKFNTIIAKVTFAVAV